MLNRITKIFPFKTLFAISLLFVLLVFSTLFLFSPYSKTTEESKDNTVVTEEESKETEETEVQTDAVVEEEETSEETTEKDSDEETVVIEKETKKKDTTPTPQPEEEEIVEEIEEEEDIPESPSAYVAFYADNQSDTDQEDINHQRVVNYILNTGANPVFHAGDLMEDGTLDSLNRFNNVTSTLRSTRTFYAALGNNDREVGDSSTPSSLFLNNFSFPNNERWYSVNYGNLHLVVLDSAFAWGNTTQLNWFLNDIQSSASQDRITGVMYHHPTFASTISSYMIQYGIDFVVAGHNHSYNHSISNDIHYFVLSGQPSLGYMTAKIYNTRVEIRVYNSSNGIVESFEFTER